MEEIGENIDLIPAQIQSITEFRISEFPPNLLSSFVPHPLSFEPNSQNESCRALFPHLFSVDKISCAVQNIREKTSQSLSNKQRLTESEFQFKAFIFRAQFFQNYYELAPTLNTKVIARSFLYKFYVHIISCVVQKSSASFS